MSEPSACLSLVTLGVSDLAKSTAFYLRGARLPPQGQGRRWRCVLRGRWCHPVALAHRGTREGCRDRVGEPRRFSRNVARLELHISLRGGSCIGASDGRGSDADPVRANCVLGRLYRLLCGSRRASLGTFRSPRTAGCCCPI